jgi:hypothetical protein
MHKGSNLLLGVLAASVSVLLSSSAAQSTSQEKPYDWTMDIKTQQLERQFDYPGSTIKPIVKTELQYYPSESESTKTKYQHIWYANGKPLGMERLHKLEITEGDGVSIRVVHKTDSPTSGEYKAAANAILRVLVDAYLNKNAIVTVRVPVASFNSIVNELRNNPHINTAFDGSDNTVDSSVPIFVQAEPSGTTIQLYYFQS